MSIDSTSVRIILARAIEADNSKPHGGKHITLTGYHSTNQNLDVSEINTSKFTSKHGNKFRLRTGNEAKIEKWKGVYTITFKSERLDKFSEELRDLGFSNIKGPIYARTKWHITLPGKNEKQAKEYLEYLRKNKKYFYLVKSVEKNKKFTYTPL